MKTIQLNLEHKQYKICIKNGLFSEINHHIQTTSQMKRIVVITDKNLYRLYGKALQKTLEKMSCFVVQIVIEPGEKSKHFSNLEVLYKSLLTLEITRFDLIIAFGGGVVGDFAGFLAATYLRGIKLIHIPTSLLSMVDSSIGGKVAVNIDEGKNLVGIFHHPEIVLIDPQLLRTLPQKEFISGMAEVIKYGCIYDENLFNEILKLQSHDGVFNAIESIIFRCCQIKSEVVAKDERDYGQRMVLNFGHTIGHALEKAFNYEGFTHGEAIAIGMYQITKISENKGITKQGTSEKIKEILIKFNLPTQTDVGVNGSLKEIMKNDKKRFGDSINFIFLRCIGQTVIRSVKISELGNYSI
ncbi:MAG: 3-dehydroquinate synthase [Alkaliphilus sp.]|nr:3-dehydroquinate synthase [Alkaliphilus sp. AH-315-G20]MBN4067626.1 3-dehydroquinate synthase [Alkaliphilus transvaalensis]PHS34874.1 MAG: 3-dehydroquinate synthase [Alkaliphilus sp.]